MKTYTIYLVWPRQRFRPYLCFFEHHLRKKATILSINLPYFYWEERGKNEHLFPWLIDIPNVKENIFSSGSIMWCDIRDFFSLSRAHWIAFSAPCSMVISWKNEPSASSCIILSSSCSRCRWRPSTPWSIRPGKWLIISPVSLCWPLYWPRFATTLLAEWLVSRKLRAITRFGPACILGVVIPVSLPTQYIDRMILPATRPMVGLPRWNESWPGLGA